MYNVAVQINVPLKTAFVQFSKHLLIKFFLNTSDVNGCQTFLLCCGFNVNILTDWSLYGTVHAAIIYAACPVNIPT